MSYNLPCVLMRGGTSRGPFFLADWLPQDPAARDRTLIAALGSPHELQIDGLGGGNSLTSKVAIVSRSVHADCDVDYLFAQVSVEEARVDTRPNCGNMLAGVGPFAIEQGLVPASGHGNTTTVRVYNVNTRSRIDVHVCTAGGRGHCGTGADELPGRLGRRHGPDFPDRPAHRHHPRPAGHLYRCRPGDGAGAGSGPRPARPRAPCRAGCQCRAACQAGSPAMRSRPADGHGRCVEQRAAQARDRVCRRSTGQRRLALFHTSPLPPLTRRDRCDWRGCCPRAARHGDHRLPAARHCRHTPCGSAAPRRPHSCRRGTHRSGRPIQAGAGRAGSHGAKNSGGHAVRFRKRIHPLISHPNPLDDRRQKMIRQHFAPSRARRTLLTAAALAAAVQMITSLAHAAYPDKPIALVVPTAAGGGNDGMARVVALKLSPLLGQQVIVENKAGANGAIAAEFVARAAPDGHTILFGYIGTHGMSPALQKLRYDPITQFEPIGMVSYSPTLMVVHPKVPAKSVGELVALTKAKPQDFNYASAGNGTAPHFSAEIFKLESGAQMAHVPYR